jgi:hypothetical protein
VGCHDLAGRVCLQATWDDLGQFVGGLATATVSGLTGYINPTGSWAIEPTFHAAKAFCGDLAVVKIENTPAYIQVDGAIVWKFEPHAIVPRPPVPI